MNITKDYYNEKYWLELAKNPEDYKQQAYEVNKKIDMIGRLDINIGKIKTALVLGCSFGHLVHRLRDVNKIDAYGMDFSHYAVDHSVVKDYIIEDSIENILNHFNLKQFDLITAFDVLEHLTYQSIKKSIEGIAEVCKEYLIIRLPTTHYAYPKYVTDLRYQCADKSHQSIYPPLFWVEQFERTGKLSWEREFSANWHTNPPSVESWLMFKRKPYDPHFPTYT